MPSFLDPLLVAGAPAMVLATAGRDARVVATTIEAAFDSRSRTKGLLGRSSLPASTAMILAPCHAIHTFKMQFPIDVIFVDRVGKVLKINANVAPSRIAIAPRGFATIEMAAGEAERCGLRRGDTLLLQPAAI